MKIGLTFFLTDETPPLRTLAPRIEALGFESMFVPEHSHIPVASKHQVALGGDVPPVYWHFLDPFVALTEIAAITTTLKLGTAISVIPLHDPISLAKTVATLDHVSNGRVILGCGPGWNALQLANHGVDIRDCWEVTRERIEAMQAIWSNDEAEYHGTFVEFDPILAWPKPVQPGGPEILMGVNGPRNVARTAHYVDGWIHIGKAPDELPPIHERGPASGPGIEKATVLANIGIESELIALRELGVERCVVRAPHDAGDGTLAAIEALAANLSSWLGPISETRSVNS